MAKEKEINLEGTGKHNGHAFVDLGLPSGLLWATCNVGATNPEDCGDYFAWGETKPKEDYNYDAHKYCNGSYNKLTKYCDSADYGNDGFTDALTTLEVSDDAATANWGNGWRMPTNEEMEELLSNCDLRPGTYFAQKVKKQNGVYGHLFTGPNGNSIFLPAAGYRSASELRRVGSNGFYWSSSLYLDGTDGAWYLYFGSDDCYMFNEDRGCGLTVRAVCQPQK